MAFTATVEWEVRTTGSNANGGGFDPVSGVPGSDYSMQDAPQVTYTDLVIDGTTNTKCTSSGHPFTSAHVGNIINITSGTGFTVQRVQVLSVAAGVATCDKALGTLSSSGGNGVLGGGLLTLAQTNTLIVAGNSVHIKSGTYTLTTAVSVSAASSYWFGYQTAHYDRTGTRPLITTATDSTKLMGFGNVIAFIANINFSNSASTRDSGVYSAASYTGFYVADCMFDGFTTAVDKAANNFLPLTLIAVEIKNASISAVSATFGPSFQGCYFHDNAKDVIVMGTGNETVSVVDCIFANNGRSCITTPGGDNGYVHASNCVFYSNGLTYAGGPWPVINPSLNARGGISNCIFYGGSVGYIGNASQSAIFVGRNNAFDGNARATAASTYKSFSDVSLSGDPFTSAASGDFSLNATVGRGAACRAAGFPGLFPGGTTTGYASIGAVQLGAAAPAGGGGSFTFIGS